MVGSHPLSRADAAEVSRIQLSVRPTPSLTSEHASVVGRADQQFQRNFVYHLLPGASSYAVCRIFRQPSSFVGTGTNYCGHLTIQTSVVPL
jgi:hypothetical protein